MSDWNAKVIEEFRANAGKVGGVFAGRPLLLLHHTGARTRTERVTPLMYQSVEEGMAIFGSKGGAATNPDWMYNLLAHPETVIEVGSERIEVRARLTEGEERDSIWGQQKQDYPFFAEYDAQTAREIPVFVLEPR